MEARWVLLYIPENPVITEEAVAINMNVKDLSKCGICFRKLEKMKL